MGRKRFHSFFAWEDAFESLPFGPLLLRGRRPSQAEKVLSWSALRAWLCGLLRFFVIENVERWRLLRSLLAHLHFGHLDPPDPLSILPVAEDAACNRTSDEHQYEDPFEDESDFLNQRRLLVRDFHVVERHIANDVVVLVDFVQLADDLMSTRARFTQKQSQCNKQHHATNMSHFISTF